MIAADGDSITFLGQDDGTSWLEAMADELRLRGVSHFATYNGGVSGHAAYNMAETAPATLDPTLVSGGLILRASAIGNIAIEWGGTNDIAIAGRTPAQTYGDQDTWRDDRLTAGWDAIIMLGILKRGGGAPGSFEADRNTVNAYRAADTTPGVTFVDVGADPFFSDYTDTAAFYDEVHPTAAGRDRIGRVHLAPAVLSILGVL